MSSGHEVCFKYLSLGTATRLRINAGTTCLWLAEQRCWWLRCYMHRDREGTKRTLRAGMLVLTTLPGASPLLFAGLGRSEMIFVADCKVFLRLADSLGVIPLQYSNKQTDSHHIEEGHAMDASSEKAMSTSQPFITSSHESSPSKTIQFEAEVDKPAERLRKSRAPGDACWLGSMGTSASLYGSSVLSGRTVRKLQVAGSNTRGEQKHKHQVRFSLGCAACRWPCSQPGPISLMTYQYMTRCVINRVCYFLLATPPPSGPHARPNAPRRRTWAATLPGSVCRCGTCPPT